MQKGVDYGTTQEEIVVTYGGITNVEGGQPEHGTKGTSGVHEREVEENMGKAQSHVIVSNWANLHFLKHLL